jgi:hypothetical protein
VFLEFISFEERGIGREHGHFHEKELLGIVVEDELHGTRTDVINGFGGRNCLCTEVGTKGSTETGSGRLNIETMRDEHTSGSGKEPNLFNDLLVSSLYRTIALP